MNRTNLLLLTIIGLAAGAIAWRYAAMLDADSLANAAMQTHERTLKVAREVTALRAAAPTTGTTGRPNEDVFALAQRACKAAALSPSLVREVSPEGERSANSGLVLQSARIGMDGLTPPELAAILKQLTTLQRVWTVQRVDLSTLDKSNGRYRVQLFVSALYTDDARKKDRPQ